MYFILVHRAVCWPMVLEVHGYTVLQSTCVVVYFILVCIAMSLA